MVEQVNPLAFIGQSQVPPPANEALRKLQTSNALARAAAADTRDLATQNNAAKLRQFALGKNLPLSREEIAGDFSPESVASMQQTRGITDAKAAAEGFDSARSAGIARQFPKQAFELKDIGSQSMLSGLPLKGELAGAAGKADAKEAAKEVLEGFEQLPDGSFVKRTSTVSAERAGQSKNSPTTTQRTNDIHAAVAAKLQAIGRQFQNLEIVGDDGTNAYVNVDGVGMTFPIRGAK
jgi:hypothetical protein